MSGLGFVVSGGLRLGGERDVGRSGRIAGVRIAGRARATLDGAPFKRGRRLRMVVEGDDEVRGGDVTEQTPPVGGTPPVQSAEERMEKAKRALERAERLQIEADRMRLESDRAQLEAEKRKLELERTKVMKMKAQPELENDTLKFVDKGEDPKKPDENKAAEMKAEEDKADKADPSWNRSTMPSAQDEDNLSGLMRAMGPLADIDIKQVSRQDVQTLRDQVFTMETFYVTQVETSTFGDRVVFRGNLRTDPSKLLDIFDANMKKYGLDKRVRLFLMEDPAAVEENKPVVVALPNEAEPRESGVGGVLLSALFFATAAFTTVGYGIGIFGANPKFMEELAAGKLDEVYHTLPVSLGILGIIISHELGHRAVAYARNIKLGRPLFIPSLQIGTYGTVTPLNSFPKTRSDFFDVMAAGPLVGMTLSFGALVTGLVLTGGAQSTEWFPTIPTALLRSSILFQSVSSVLLPEAMMKTTTLPVHPMTVVGAAGMLINAINLIPIGRLDGGRIVQALYGRIIAGRVSGISLLLQGLGAILGNSPLLLFWGLIAVFFQSRADIPCQDEITEPDNTRSIVGLAGLVLMVLILSPYPDLQQSIGKPM